MSDFQGRIAGAPISWGVCEVTGWGHQMTADRVLEEMAVLGLGATEAGPEGWLPADASKAKRMLEGRGLRLVGGFVPLVLHTPDGDALGPVERAARWLAAAGAELVVIAAAGPRPDYERELHLSNQQWRRLLSNLDAARDAAAKHGLVAVLHPHAGTAVERKSEIQRVLEGSSVPLCLDTGHQVIGGFDPVDLVTSASGRIGHVHLKDLSFDLAERVARGRLSYADAVRAGMYRPLGEGDVDFSAVVGGLEGAGYDGWYVVEQDVILAGPPPPMSGPIDAVRSSVNYVESILKDAGARRP